MWVDTCFLLPLLQLGEAAPRQSHVTGCVTGTAMSRAGGGGERWQIGPCLLAVKSPVRGGHREVLRVGQTLIAGIRVWMAGAAKWSVPARNQQKPKLSS